MKFILLIFTLISPLLAVAQNPITLDTTSSYLEKLLFPPLKNESNIEKGCLQIAEREPEPLQKIKIKYPPEAKKAGIEGKVTFSALINKDGKVEKVVIDKSDNDIFRQPVIDAVKETEFISGCESGKPVRAWYTETVRFKLDSDVAEPIHR